MVFAVVEGAARSPAVSEEALLLREAHHRTANEIAAAIAAMRLASSSRCARARPDLLAAAIGRLEGFGTAHAILGHRVGAVDLACDLDRLCAALLSARPVMAGGTLDIECDPGRVEAALGRRVLLVTAELVANAVRHVLVPRGGRVMVRLRIAPTRLDLLVADDGPGMSAATSTSGTGLGSGLVRELVANGGGAIEMRSGVGGTAVAVSFPVAPAPAVGARRRAQR